MIFLLNVILGLLAGLLVDHLLRRAGADPTIAIVCAVIAGIIVYLANLASQVVK